jgi:hypothetical protein
MLDNDIMPKICSRFVCEKCDYRTSKKSSYDNHIYSIKHKNKDITTGNNENMLMCSKKYNCQNCSKLFNDRAGLWRHKKNCIKVEIPNIEPSDKDLIMMLIKENSELKNMMMEVIKNGTHNTTTTNSHNKAFNLNFFLNETCKDAMNITEFVNSIQLQLSDLERMGEVGYVEGLSSIISRNLKALDINMRPVHCTDKKREIMYIKDETKWEKDDENVKMHKMVRNVAFENQRQILKYKEIHPDCGKSTSKYSDAYNKILVECMGGPGNNDFEKEEKIISKISKCVLVDKDN